LRHLHCLASQKRNIEARKVRHISQHRRDNAIFGKINSAGVHAAQVLLETADDDPGGAVFWEIGCLRRLSHGLLR